MNLLTKDQIQDWLDQKQRSREWLAEKLAMSKGAVDQGFSTRGFSSKALATIRLLMQRDEEQNAPPDETSLIQFSSGEFERIERARLGLGYQSRPEMYRDAVLDYVTHYEENEDATPAKIVRYDDKKPVKGNRVAEGGSKS